MKTFKLFRGYTNPLLEIDWDGINRIYPIPTIVPTWQGINYQPTWVVNPGLIQYTPPNYNTITIPNYNITTTPGTGTYTIPLNGTINTSTGFNLTTSNPNGITYTTGGFGGTLTTNTAMFTSKF